ncbi:oxysterol binding family protein [Tieghemostelium lacteum]|uniref:Oxysterol binding family protein n=1 Tax=Tieghemostelium lacteum TaxID=361077 RepID=A0A151Z3R6_TIELA|nr:oxysterol binding family protein [Tieghemostelium lacteum]|eukprot:KYQ88613.1 oxysterol binding family protein [Tieghemostelium lacteum]
MSFFKKIVGKSDSPKGTPKGTPKGSPTSGNTPKETSPKGTPKSRKEKKKIEKERKLRESNTDQNEIDEIDFGKEAENDDAPQDKKSLWSKISGLVGKDPMSLVSLPVYFFEPLTVLESQAEPLRFYDLLEEAISKQDPVERMLYITAFNISIFSSYVRTAKPFNPLLGETFEYIPKQGNYRTFCEQVSHHPPIGLCETQAKNFNLQQESWIATKFWGTSLDVFSLGQNHLYLPTHNNEHYTWKIPSAICHNLLIGKMWIEHHGDLIVKNHTSGESAQVKFYKSGIFESTTKKVAGEIKDSTGKTRYLINGRWCEYINAVELNDNGDKVREFIIWRAKPDPMEKENKWKHGEFLQSLNELTPEMEEILPPTDSRLRLDRRLLQNGDNKNANREKNKIEERQREIRKQREAKGVTWLPRYFTKVEDATFGYRWVFNSTYWNERAERIESLKEKSGNKAPEIPQLSSSHVVQRLNPATTNINNNNNIILDGDREKFVKTTTTTTTTTTYHTPSVEESGEGETVLTEHIKTPISNIYTYTHSPTIKSEKSTVTPPALDQVGQGAL